MENLCAHSSDGKDGLLFSPVLGDTGLHEAENIGWILTFNWIVPFPHKSSWFCPCDISFCLCLSVCLTGLDYGTQLVLSLNVLYYSYTTLILYFTKCNY